VVVAIFGARWLILRYGRQGGVGGTHAAPMQVLARAGIDHRQQLLLVRLGERLLLVGSASGSLSTLSEITDAEEVDRLTRQARKRGGFGALLRKKESEMNDASERQSPDVERLKRRLNGATRDHERET
jgi:flagellar biogenesis protein FliO